jgi:hypothetical protein
VRPLPPGGSQRPTRPRGRAGHPIVVPPRRPSSLPLAARLILIVAIALLAAVAFAGASGGVAHVVGALAAGVSRTLAAVTSTPLPSPTPPPPLSPPTLQAPAQAYTNQPTVEIDGTLPAAFVGRSDLRIRLYVSRPPEGPTPVDEQAVGASALFAFPDVPLAPGVNDFTVTLVGAGGEESSPSDPVRYVLDTAKPKVAVTSPKDGAVVSTATVQVVGKTQGHSTVIVRNEATGTSVATVAGGDGSFSLTVPLALGPNGLQITATDPAGNQGTAVLSVTRSSGALTAVLRASAYRFSAARLPQPITLQVTVTGPDGGPLEGAAVTFTLSIPGIPTLTTDATTNGAGEAEFTTTIPRGASLGTGPAAVLVTTPDGATTTARTAITIDK